MLLFRSEEHVNRWCETWSMQRGGILTLEQAWDLARAWYGQDRRDVSWRRHTAEEARTLFRQLGLHSAFWEIA